MQTHVMALRAGRPEHTPEAEPLLVTVEGDEVLLELDDGDQLTCDRSELLVALGVPTERLRAA